jgi:hypothetical protein
MAKAKAESQDHGSRDQSNGKATAKTSRLSRPKSLELLYMFYILNTTIVGSFM